MRLSATVAGEPVVINALPRPAEEGQWDQFLLDRENDPIFGYDVESTTIEKNKDSTFDPDARLRLVQFASKTEAWVLDPHDVFWRPRIEALFGTGGADSYRFVSHTDFDVLWAWREFGIELGDASIDTMPMACLVYPGTPPAQTVRHGLKELCDLLIDPGLSAAEDALYAEFRRLFSEWKMANLPVGERRGGDPIAWGYTNVPMDNKIWLLYAGLDAINVRRLLDILDHKLRRRLQAKLSRREQRIARLSTGMTYRGCLLDVDYTQERFDEIGGEYETVRDAFITDLGFSPDSPKYPAWLDSQGVDGERTENGQLQLTVDAPGRSANRRGVGRPQGKVGRVVDIDGRGTLPDLIRKYAADDAPKRHDNPEVRRSLDDKLYLSSRKNLRNNLKSMLALRDADGFVHPRINTQQAITGRMSITEPALQTFKKEDLRLRRCGVARRGFVLVRADYDNQEVRLAAALTRDRALLRIVRLGLNQHEITCASLFGAAKATDHDGTPYKSAKVLDFAQQYCAGPRTIAGQLGIADEKAYRMWLKWRETYAGLVSWTEDIAQLAAVKNDWGRLIPRDKYRHYANGNYMIQSSGRDMLGDAIIRLDEAGWSDTFWLFLHDEIVLEVPEDEAEQAAKALESAMHTTFHGIEFTATAKILGPWWSGEETSD